MAATNLAVFYKCEICENVAILATKGKGKLFCCGKPMVEMKPNTVDASLEKHVPVARRENGKITVEVGSVPHPMTEEHYIQWIVVAGDNGMEIIALTPSDAPKAEFVDRPNAEAYEYCNLHGLWKGNVEG